MNANWIPDVNRFGVPKPPDWFLTILWDQDAALVVLPSRQSRKYLLARRRNQSRIIANIVRQQLNPTVHKRIKYLDSDLLESLSLVPVDAITSLTGDLFNVSWMTSCPEILKDLRDRDMWAAGGAEKYIEKIEGQEADVEKQRRADLLDSIDHRASDAWRSYQARTGQRNQRAGSGSATIVPVGTL